MRGWWRTIGTTAVTLALAGAGGLANVGAQAETGFEPLKPGEIIAEQLPATPLVFAAYAAVWVALLIYMLSLWRRIGRIERELADVTARLDSR